MEQVTVVFRDICAPGPCNYRCINLCPVNMTGKKSKPIIVPRAIKLRKKSAIPTIDPKTCINCGICVNACYVRAIKSVNIPGEMDTWVPTHQYRESQFRLFGLPALNLNNIIGIIGENGVGKSTLLDILAGKLQPNGGKFTSDAYQEFLTTLRIPGMSRFLEKVNSGEVTVAFKKQDLTFLKDKNETLRSLMSNLPIEDKKIIDLLQLRPILDKSSSVASGGELQRIAIALTLLQPADVYLLDEPATYLDIQQRLKLVRALKTKLNDSRAIAVVEHDISVLDYWSDHINICWGSPHVYGVISRALSVKKGLNSFLTGWLREENIHFRRRVITFKRSVKERLWKDRMKLDWPEAQIKLNGFSLDVTPGNIYQGEILVILGENGLGKTTFANLLAGKIPHHDIEMAATISYKPQQITKEFDVTVQRFLQEVTGKFLNTKSWKLQLLDPLGINHFMERKMRELSGGETQRVFIAACLARDAKLYILDEPSAFLDALERTKIASVIRNQTKRDPTCSVMTIEHDIQLADFTADRVMIFEGKPGSYGEMIAPMSKRVGMNRFLKHLGITFRRDPETGRARINKEGSKMDKRQKELGEYYYTLE
ncbi:MAG: ribosome biogenesis/translation initiation ATPase RLI [Candidatus Heimdallarchaeota archaeon]